MSSISQYQISEFRKPYLGIGKPPKALHKKRHRLFKLGQIAMYMVK